MGIDSDQSTHEISHYGLVTFKHSLPGPVIDYDMIYGGHQEGTAGEKFIAIAQVELGLIDWEMVDTSIEAISWRERLLEKGWAYEVKAL